jgi:hypothetical protein
MVEKSVLNVYFYPFLLTIKVVMVRVECAFIKKIPSPNSHFKMRMGWWVEIYIYKQCTSSLSPLLGGEGESESGGVHL